MPRRKPSVEDNQLDLFGETDALSDAYVKVKHGDEHEAKGILWHMARTSESALAKVQAVKLLVSMEGWGKQPIAQDEYAFQGSGVSALVARIEADREEAIARVHGKLN